MTPDPVPDSLWPVTSIVTTLGMILAAAALTVPSSFGELDAVWLVTVIPLDTDLSWWSTAATTPAPTPPPTSAATTAAIRTVRVAVDFRPLSVTGSDGTGDGLAG